MENGRIGVVIGARGMVRLMVRWVLTVLGRLMVRVVLVEVMEI